MEQNVKMIVGGLVLFVLGGLSVYLVISRPNAAPQPTPVKPVQSAPVSDPVSTSTSDTSASASIVDAESFYEAAEARREQQMADKAEADRLAKLKAIKERSVECTFWKQQQKTSSAAAKITEKITQYCTLQTSSSESTSSEANTSSANLPDATT